MKPYNPKKKCNSCNLILPNNGQYFGYSKKYRDGYQVKCLDCRKKENVPSVVNHPSKRRFINSVFRQKFQNEFNKSGYTKIQLAKEIGITSAAISLFLSGRRGVSFEMAVILAKKMNISLDDFKILI